jgi:hypothetical protein
MKAACTTLLSLAVALVVLASARADDEKKPEPKKVTLKGTLVCGKCKLKETEACSNALVVKGKDGKEVVYYLDDKGRKEKYHACTAPKEGYQVTGAVTEKDKKKYIKPEKDGVKPSKKAD